jgi:hypothetical protein
MESHVVRALKEVQESVLDVEGRVDVMMEVLALRAREPGGDVLAGDDLVHAVVVGNDRAAVEEQV